MTERDKLEVGSKFWNKGKWDNFVNPLLPTDCKDLTFVDMGCNSGLFLKFAEDKGFKNVLGVDSDKIAVERGLKWRDKQGGTYKMLNSTMEEGVDQIPIADYTTFVNSHYYFMVNDWIEFLDKLQLKTRYCIIVTAEKRHLNRCWASAGVEDIRRYFKTWEEVGFINELPTKGDPVPRRLWALCFKSPAIDKVSVDGLDSSNHVQDQFYGELDKGTPYKDTRYYRILKKYRAEWGEPKLNQWIEEKISLYNDLKKNGVKKSILVDYENRILDGNHRYSMLKSLGYKEVFIRKV